MKVIERWTCAIALVASLNCGTAPAPAQDKALDQLTVAIGQMENWANQVATLGMRAGIFQKHGIELKTYGTQGAGETLQPIIAGSADIGVGVGTAAAMRAFAKGAPVRALAAGFTGANDTYWYVRPDSPIKTLSDLTALNTIAYSTNGSNSHVLVLGFAKELGIRAKATPTGGSPATMTLVMSGQIDVGWGVPPTGVEEALQGKIRIIASGADVPATRNQTLRLVVVNADALKAKKDVMTRFLQAYRETLDWMYTSPDAVRYYAETVRKPESAIREMVRQFYPKEAISPDRVSNIDKVMAVAVMLKLLDAPLTAEQLVEFFQIPPRKK